MFNLIFFAVVAVTLAQAEPVVKTPLGDVEGKHLTSYEGRPYSAFQGIPYAKPPVGDLRFKEPEPVEKWSDTLTADKTYTCMQYTAGTLTKDVVGDEDCLYLYVYVPREKITGKENFDVVVHLHGGDFTTGDPASLAGPNYIMDRDLILVTLNYRLGILGFLSTQDEALPGNNGLKDQVLALKWVKDNIQSFGGNPDSVTLTGTSAGAASVHYHYLSPLSKDLFHRGLSQSGTALNSWALTTRPIDNAKKLGQTFGCELNTTKELVDCLRSKEAKDVVAAHENFTVFANAYPPTPFGPVIEIGEGAFLPDHPVKMLLEGRVRDLPWITSNTEDDGFATIRPLVEHEKLQELGNRWTELAPYILNYNNTAHEIDKKTIATIVRSYYLGDEPLSAENIKGLVKLFTDRYYHIDAVRALCMQATVTRSPVYYYYFDYPTEISNSSSGNFSVVSQGDDTKLLFHNSENPEELPENDRKMKNVFIDFLYRYASTGKPDFRGLEWKPVYRPVETVSWIHVSSPETIQRERGLNLGLLAFWHAIPLLENEHLFPILLKFVPYLTFV